MPPKTISRSTRRPLVSPLRYPGGKSALYSRLRSIIERSDLTEITYVEPFAGGAGAGLALLVSGCVRRVVINDLDPAIYAFWSTVKHESQWLIHKTMTAKLTIPEWRKQQEIYAAADTRDLASLGFATFYLNRTNRSGVLNGGPIGGLDQSGSYKMDARFNREGLAQRFQLLSQFSESIHPISADGINVIGEYCQQSNAFIYADPPYFEKAKSLYLNAFTFADHKSLAATLNHHSDANWLLTYDRDPEVFNLYQDRRIREYQLNYSAHRVSKATELAVISDSLPDIDHGWTQPD